MKHQYLYVALAVVPVVWMRSMYGWLWIACVMYYAYRHLTKRHLILIIMVLFQLQGISTIPEPPSNVLVVQVEEIKSNYMIAKSEDQRILLYQVEGVSFGDILEVKGKAQRIAGLRNFYQFDFSAWASRRGIYYGMQVDSFTLIEASDSARATIYRHIKSLPEEETSYVLSTLYGIQEEDEDVHFMVSSSGMHLSFIAHLIQVVLSLWLPIPMASVISLASILCLGSITTLKDAILRILIFRLVSLILPKASSQDRLGISILVLLALCPYMANELAFILPVSFRLVYLFNIKKRSRYVLSFLVLIPIQFYYFQQVDLIQILLFPFLRTVYALNYLCVFIFLILPFYPIYMIAQTILRIANSLTKLSVRFYHGTNVFFCLLWFMVVMRILSRNERKDVAFLILMCLYTQFHPYLNPFLQIQMIDVGQGDSTLISLPFNRGNILIDIAGNRNKNIPEDVIVPMLRAKNIHQIDLAIITHDDFDHSGGIEQFQELMPIHKIIRDKQEDVTFHDFRFSFLLSDIMYEDKNENSLITYLEAYDMRLLFMGDAGKNAEAIIEKRYPDLRADILKVGHHGSKTSSSQSFLHRLHPQMALISCGFNNMYGHPSPETISSLDKEGIYTLDTPSKGAVSINLSSFLRFYKTATSEFGIISKGDNL